MAGVLASVAVTFLGRWLGLGPYTEILTSAALYTTLKLLFGSAQTHGKWWRSSRPTAGRGR